jgi:hypothetical protein
MCDLVVANTLMHRFYKYPKAQIAWALVATIFSTLKNPRLAQSYMKRLDIIQCLIVNIGSLIQTPTSIQGLHTNLDILKKGGYLECMEQMK